MTDPERFKNVSLDVESYEDLKLWADRDVRTVSGQIKWLIQKSLPKDLRNYILLFAYQKTCHLPE